MKKDYSGKEVFVGIDVHKKSYSVYCVCDRTRVKSWSMEANPGKLIEQLKQYFSGAEIHTVYEAGFSGFALHRELTDAGIHNIVVNPGSVETASRDRVKTDKRDAKKLSEQLSEGRLKCIHIPSLEEELLRLNTRMRATLVGDRKRITCRIKSKLFQFGYNELIPREKKAANALWIKKARDYEGYSAELKDIIHYLCEQWLKLTEDIKEIDKKIAKQSKSNERCIIQETVYQSVPGIGALSSKELSRELGDLKQFNSNKRTYSYVGLTPSESSSGERRKQGGISHCGRPRLRHLLIEIAWRSINKDPELSERFAKLSYRRGKKRAIVAIARTLLGRIRTCFIQGVLYQQQQLTTDKG